MALLLPGGHLGRLGGSADGVGGSVEGAWTPPIVPGGLRWGLETGEIAHLLALAFSAFPALESLTAIVSIFVDMGRDIRVVDTIL